MAEVRATHISGAAKGRKPETLSDISPWFLEDMSRVFSYGRTKYPDKKPGLPNYLTGGYPWSWTIDALKRHISEIEKGNWLDDGPGGSGLPHASAAAWHLHCIYEFHRLGLGVDDRWHIRGRLAQEAKSEADKAVGDTIEKQG